MANPLLYAVVGAIIGVLVWLLQSRPDNYGPREIGQIIGSALAAALVGYGVAIFRNRR